MESTPFLRGVAEKPDWVQRWSCVGHWESVMFGLAGRSNQMWSGR